MSQYNNSSEQLEKGNYIANILVRTLYSNDVNNAECYRIIKLFTEKVLGELNCRFYTAPAHIPRRPATIPINIITPHITSVSCAFPFSNLSQQKNQNIANKIKAMNPMSIPHSSFS